MGMEEFKEELLELLKDCSTKEIKMVLATTRGIMNKALSDKRGSRNE